MNNEAVKRRNEYKMLSYDLKTYASDKRRSEDTRLILSQAAQALHDAYEDLYEAQSELSHIKQLISEFVAFANIGKE